jgi:hypothetical protein
MFQNLQLMTKLKQKISLGQKSVQDYKYLISKIHLIALLIYDI